MAECPLPFYMHRLLAHRMPLRPLPSFPTGSDISETTCPAFLARPLFLFGAGRSSHSESPPFPRRRQQLGRCDATTIPLRRQGGGDASPLPRTHPPFTLG